MKRFLIAISVAWTACQAFANGAVGDVLKQIEQNNLTLQALAHDNRADVLDTRAANAPGGLSVEYSPFYKKGYSGLAESELVVSQEIDFPTRYAARNKQTKMLKETGTQQLEKLRRDILLDAEILCIDVIRINQTLTMLQQRRNASEALRTIFEKRMEAGDANILEFNKVKLDCMEVNTLVTEAQNERLLLLQQLQQLNGGKAIDITTTEMPVFPAIDDFESFKTLALANNADIRVAETERAAAVLDRKVQKSEWLPNITFGYRRNTDQGEHVDGMVVGLSLPMYTNKRRMKAASERIESANIRVEQTRQEAETALMSRYQQLRALQQVLDHSDVKMMQETLGLFAKALQQGEITALVYYDEVNSIYEKLQKHIDTHFLSMKLMAELHKNEL